MDQSPSTFWFDEYRVSQSSLSLSYSNFTSPARMEPVAASNHRWLVGHIDRPE
uniref:Uncharacterized protein n=1 Tax=Nelumbo nucifera TaxID=4432 RepID=A0A822YEH4_NELNU|nr:TPA_asm: hypothetical protein HUJ06_029366 [Nelumbo nucifera]